MPTSASSALLTDHYELTMLDAALRDGAADRPAVFEAFTRKLPEGRRFGVAAGLGRILEELERFRFDDPTLAYLDDRNVVSPATLAWLSGYRFRGEVYAFHEGEPFVPDEPVLTVSATFADAVVLETLVLSILNHDSAIASAAARIARAAEGRSLLEFGTRRTHEQAAVAAARAAYVAGFDGTSNLAAGQRYGIPTLGTSAHAFTLLHDDERAAFHAQVDALGSDTTLLVDTYDVRRGVERALDAAGTSLGGIRIDSGDLAEHARTARAQLDAAGATGTRIVVSGDLNEDRIRSLRDAPIDGYGVGTDLVTGGGAPTAWFVYKLVARALERGGPCEPVAKAGGHKATVGGRKRVSRRLDGSRAIGEVVRPWKARVPSGERPLQVPVIVDGERVYDPSLDDIRAHHAAACAELPPDAFAPADATGSMPSDWPVFDQLDARSEQEVAT